MSEAKRLKFLDAEIAKLKKLVAAVALVRPRKRVERWWVNQDDAATLKEMLA